LESSCRARSADSDLAGFLQFKKAARFIEIAILQNIDLNIEGFYNV
jgi:hypothetical protein